VLDLKSPENCDQPTKYSRDTVAAPASKALDTIKKTVQMDFVGQWLSDTIMQGMIISFGILSFLVGWFKSSMSLMMSLYGLGCLLTFLIAVPNWPMYNKNPLVWRSAGAKAKSKGKESWSSSLRRLFE